ncbi:MAG: nickel pincer cofactor biosynthesis protein LarB [Tepidisphaerales bacterium]
MNSEALQQLLHAVAAGQTSVNQAVERLRSLPFEQTEYASLDHHRAVRCGHPEVIFCPGKTVDQFVKIAQRLAAAGSPVLATRASAEQIAAARQHFPGVTIASTSVLVQPPPAVEPQADKPFIAVVAAGTADSPVADEAMLTLRCMSVPTHRITDVGIAGLHRLLPHVPMLQKCCAMVVIAGMEGALPSAVGGLVACPVFAVPTSVGYGANLGGLTTLLAMLTSCVANVSVVNIDNGFGAALCAALTYQQVRQSRASVLAGHLEP